jgi:hypothetical protein
MLLWKKIVKSSNEENLFKKKKRQGKSVGKYL